MNMPKWPSNERKIGWYDKNVRPFQILELHNHTPVIDEGGILDPYLLDGSSLPPSPHNAKTEMQ